ncbi:MAG: DUF4157 domain-containing protein [Bacteroidota bacterium]
MKAKPTEKTPVNHASLNQQGVQTKLEVGQPNDKYEQEADAVADRVMMKRDKTEEEDKVMMKPTSGGSDINLKCLDCEKEEKVQRSPQEEGDEDMVMTKPLIQRQPTEEPEEEKDILMMKPDVQRQPSEEAEDEEGKLQMKPAIQKAEDGKQYASADVSNQLNRSKGQGQSLPPQVNAEMSQKIGADFSNVNIHTSAEAAQMSKDLGAKAFTHGNDIYFNQGNYDPNSSQGQHLLAHELTHTVQQGASQVPAVQKEDDDSGPMAVYTVDNSDTYGTISGWTLSEPVVIDSAESMVDGVLERIGDRQISYLSITDHGNPNSLSIGNDWISADNFDAYASTLGRLNGHFASGAAVHLTHCKIGSNSEVLCKLSDLWGVNVYAGTGDDRTQIRHNMGEYMQCDPQGRYFPAVDRPSAGDFNTTPTGVLRELLQNHTILNWDTVRALVFVMTDAEKQALASDSHVVNGLTRRFRLSRRELNDLFFGLLDQNVIDVFADNECPSCHRDYVRIHEDPNQPIFDWEAEQEPADPFEGLLRYDPNQTNVWGEGLNEEQIQMLQQWLESANQSR